MRIWMTWMRGGLVLAALGLPLAAGCNNSDDARQDDATTASGRGRVGTESMPGDPGRPRDVTPTYPSPDPAKREQSASTANDRGAVPSVDTSAGSSSGGTRSDPDATGGSSPHEPANKDTGPGL